MNIANIFGLHTGCNVKTGGSIGKLVSVGGDYGLVGVKENKSYHDDYVEYQIIDCKLLLTPLSKITEEDKREFLKKFEVEFKSLTLEKGVLQIHKQIKRDLTVYECFWLASKGYDIGIVEDEYKEIVE